MNRAFFAILAFMLTTPAHALSIRANPSDVGCKAAFDPDPYIRNTGKARLVISVKNVDVLDANFGRTIFEANAAQAMCEGILAEAIAKTSFVIIDTDPAATDVIALEAQQSCAQ